MHLTCAARLRHTARKAAEIMTTSVEMVTTTTPSAATSRRSTRGICTVPGMRVSLLRLWACRPSSLSPSIALSVAAFLPATRGAWWGYTGAGVFFENPDRLVGSLVLLVQL